MWAATPVGCQPSAQTCFHGCQAHPLPYQPLPRFVLFCAPCRRDGTAKLGDVGLSKIMAGDYVSGVVGTLAW